MCNDSFDATECCNRSTVFASTNYVKYNLCSEKVSPISLDLLGLLSADLVANILYRTKGPKVTIFSKYLCSIENSRGVVSFWLDCVMSHSVVSSQQIKAKMASVYVQSF